MFTIRLPNAHVMPGWHAQVTAPPRTAVTAPELLLLLLFGYAWTRRGMSVPPLPHVYRHHASAALQAAASSVQLPQTAKPTPEAFTLLVLQRPDIAELPQPQSSARFQH